MIPILSARGAEAIEGAARARALLVFDFDGTLAPIVADRDAARMRESTRALLGRVAVAYPTAIVSGRARSDVAARVAGTPLVAIVGNHGGEDADTPDPRIRRRVGAWAAALRDALDELAGVEIEDKGLSLAVHYRRSDRPEEALRRIGVVACALPGARVTGGLAVVNVCPAEAPSKGTAIAALARRTGAAQVLFVGDDVTDEDAFLSPAVDVPVRVGPSDASAARWILERQEDVDALLGALLAARARVADPIPRAAHVAARTGGDE